MKTTLLLILAAFAVSIAQASPPAQVRIDQILRTQIPATLNMCSDDGATLAGIISGSNLTTSYVTSLADANGGLQTVPVTIDTSGNLNVPGSGSFSSTGTAFNVSYPTAGTSAVSFNNPNNGLGSFLNVLFQGSNDVGTNLQLAINGTSAPTFDVYMNPNGDVNFENDNTGFTPIRIGAITAGATTTYNTVQVGAQFGAGSSTGLDVRITENGTGQGNIANFHSPSGSFTIVDDGSFNSLTPVGFIGNLISMVVNGGGPEFTVDQSGNVVATGVISAGQTVAASAAVSVGTLLNLTPQAPATTPTATQPGSVAVTSAFIGCIWTGAAWVRLADGTTPCVF